MEPSSSSSGSLKRAKGFSDIRHVVSCLVDGCNSDLSQCREYHRRHKVCELHSKTPKVTIGGREQRFCQQCSRFHSLMEFDDGKRSCRKRLDGHNRRRRKPQSDAVTKNPGRFLSNQQGTTLLSFNITPQLLPSAMINSSWPENNVVPYYSHDNLGSTHNSFGGGNQFKNVPGYDFSISKPSFYKPVLDQNSVSRISNGLATRVVDSDCALSLLSSATSENREISISPTLLHHNMQYCEELSQFSRGIDIKPGTYIANLQSLGLFQNGPGGPSSSGPDPTLSFKWE